jgi:RNA polymerase sigma-70 factor, ECF subfamily
LLERIVEGDREAFRALYLDYHKRLARFLSRFLRRHDLIEEVINDTMYAVWCKAAGFRGESRLSTWIFGIAYRKALKAVRKDGRDPTVDGSFEMETPATLHDPEAHQRELRQCLDLALATLPAPQRIVIELAYYVGHSCEEIATITTTPVNTIKTRLFHARERLRALLPELREGDMR